MRRAISCVTWLPKSRIRTRSVMRRASFSFLLWRASFDEGADIGPGIGLLVDGDSPHLPFPAGDDPSAQLRIEAAEGIELQRPEMEIGMARLGEAPRHLAQQARPDPAAIAPGHHIDRIDLG